jgi:hypothetical protein
MDRSSLWSDQLGELLYWPRQLEHVDISFMNTGDEIELLAPLAALPIQDLLDAQVASLKSVRLGPIPGLVHGKANLDLSYFPALECVDLDICYVNVKDNNPFTSVRHLLPPRLRAFTWRSNGVIVHSGSD